MGRFDGLIERIKARQNVRYFKLVSNGYIISIGTGDGGEEITAEEYDEINAIIADKPTLPEGYGYRLTAALEWEQYELPPAPDPETQPANDAAELLELLLGGEDNG